MQKTRKFITMLLCMALLLSCFPQVYATGTKTYCAYGHSSHSGITCDAEMITWNEWESTTSLPTSGNYYLSGDVTISSSVSPSGLNLDLNGCNITRTLTSSSTGSACNVFSVATGKSFLLTDTNAERTGIVSVSFSNGKSVANTTLGKVVKVGPNATMKLYGGIIDGSNIIGNNKNNVTNAVLNVENGTDKNDAAFYMYGGKIIGYHNYNEVDGTKTYYNGSAIIARAGTTLEIRGGEVVGGTSKNGACIYSNTNNTRILGGTLVGGKVSSAGACMYVNAQTVTIGDVISDGGIYIYASAAKLTLTGAPQITNTCSSGYGICFGASSTETINATGLSKDARINIKNNRSTLTSAILKVDEDLSGCFTFVNPNYRAKYDASAQTISMEYYIATDNTSCKCSDCKGETIPQWSVWDGTAKAGHFYLDKNMELTETINVDIDGMMVLNLNGNTLSKSTAGSMFRLQGNAKFAIMDGSSDASGAMIGTAGEGSSGALIATESANAGAEIYDGNFSVSNPTVKADKGALIYAAAGSVTVAGGVFQVGSANHGDTIYAASGSSLTLKGDPKIEGGVEIAANVSVNVSETPVVRKTAGGSAYSLKTASPMTLGVLSVGARILITGTEEILLASEFVNTNAFDTKNYFTADSENMRIKEVNDTIKLVPILIDEAVIQARRDAAEAYMRSMATTLWTATEDITYCFSRTTDDPSTASSGQLIHIKAGRTYMGLPYAYSATTRESFLEYAGEPDENGIYPISGLTYQAMSGLSSQTRMGNDCSSSVATSWSMIGASVYATTSAGYVPRYGIVNIGDYIPEESYGSTGTAVVIEKNGAEVMYESYALLQKADALVRYKSANNHTMMVVSVTVVRNEDGSINPTQSYAIVLEQTSTNVRNQRTKTVEGIGTVYEIYGVDKKYSFEYLVNNTYIPVTCMEFVDASPIEEVEVTDSIEIPTEDNLFEGTITCNYFVDCVTITITDENGNVIQQAAQNAYRSRQREFRMEEFITGLPRNWSRGVIDLEALPVGQYHCDVVCRLTTGATYTMRSFDFGQTESSAVILNTATGKGYTDIADALADCAEGDELKLLATVNGDINITKAIVLDLNGWGIIGNLTANGCQLKDSQTDDYTVNDTFGYGKITGSITGAAPLDGYLYIEDIDGQSFHKIDVNIDKVTLRANSAGIYYTGEFLYDEVVAKFVDAYGVTMSTSNESPVADDTDSSCLYTTSANSVLLKNILSGSAEDAEKAEMNVYASAYVKFADGSILYSEVTATNLKALVETIDAKLWNNLTEAQQNAVLEMYKTYEATMSTWNIPNIQAQ